MRVCRSEIKALRFPPVLSFARSDCPIRAGVFTCTAVKAFVFIYTSNVVYIQANCSCRALVYTGSATCAGIYSNFCYHFFHPFRKCDLVKSYCFSFHKTKKKEIKDDRIGTFKNIRRHFAAGESTKAS